MAKAVTSGSNVIMVDSNGKRTAAPGIGAASFTAFPVGARPIDVTFSEAPCTPLNASSALHHHCMHHPHCTISVCIIRIAPSLCAPSVLHHLYVHHPHCTINQICILITRTFRAFRRTSWFTP
jgi:hypothetical protein